MVNWSPASQKGLQIGLMHFREHFENLSSNLLKFATINKEETLLAMKIQRLVNF